MKYCTALKINVEYLYIMLWSGTSEDLKNDEGEYIKDYISLYLKISNLIS